MMIKRDYYQVLGLEATCTPQQIKKNYHKLALVWHPDKHTNKSEAEVKFTEINEAYCILNDSQKRKEYDMFGHKDMSQDQFNARDFFCQKGFHGTNKSAFDILQGIFDENDEDDDDFFENFKAFEKISDTFTSNLKSFIHDNVMSSDNEDADADGFFESYTPTFMDTSFFNFPSFFKHQSDTNTTQHTEFFSFFSTMDTDNNSFSQSSTAFFEKGKAKTSKKQKAHKSAGIFEKDKTHSTLRAEKSRSSKSTSKPRANKKSQEVITVEDDEEDEDSDEPRLNTNILSGKSKSSPLKKNKGTQPRDSMPEFKGSKREGGMFCIDDLISGQFELFSDCDFSFLQKNCKKNKK